MNGELMDKVEHFEIPAANPDRALKFYTTVFGWELNPVPGVEYVRLLTIRVNESNLHPRPFEVNGAIISRNRNITAPVVTISVADIEDSLERIEKEGGTILIGKTPFGSVGFTAYFKDTEGNAMELWQPRTRG